MSELSHLSMRFVASRAPEARKALGDLTATYGQVSLQDAEVVVALGGDGTILRTLHQCLKRDVPIYGMHRGRIGFLTNPYRTENLPERIGKAAAVRLHPIAMTAINDQGKERTALAFNEISLLRQTRQSAHITISVDGICRLEECIGDGLLLATAAGSSAYNYSAHGPIIPLNANLLALTPINVFRPRRWRGALLPRHSTISLAVREHRRRPVSATADRTEVRNVAHIHICEQRDIGMTLLFDPAQSLEERIIAEQFIY